jgi:hypothetical protein
MERSWRWKGPILEGTAVLIGILTAFGIDAAWGVRQDRRTEAAYLYSLHAELEANRELLRASVDAIDADIRATEAYIIVVTTASPESVSQDSLRAMTRNMSPLRVVPLQRAAYQDLLAGGLQRIADAEVRRLILEYGRAAELDGVRQQANQEWFAQRALAYDELEADLVGMGSGYDEGWAGRRDLFFEADPSAFIGNRRYANILAARAYFVRILRDTRLNLLARLEDLEARIAPRRTVSG